MNEKQLIKLQNDDLEIFAAKLAVVGSTLSEFNRRCIVYIFCNFAVDLNLK